jgi:hypothetical protein
MEQDTNYEIQRERMEAEQKADELAKSNFSDIEMDRLQCYFEDNIEDYMEDDPDIEEAKFIEWFDDQPYHELLEIINK